VKALVLSAEVRQLQAEILPCEGYDVDLADRHSLLAAGIARRLLGDRTASQDAFSAAKLKETGALVLMSRLPEDFRRIVDMVRASGRPVREVEVEVLGVTHAEIGAYLLGIWGLPFTIVESVAYQHAPWRSSPTSMDAVCAVHVASALAEEVEAPDRVRHIGSGIKLDTALLEQLGVMESLPAWRQIAREEAERGGPPVAEASGFVG
jgi:HD-like signal output (HDOD) protein